MEPGHNSTAPTSPGADLSSKYTKLASEYSKVRAQLSVLKKAVVDEQVKNYLSEHLFKIYVLRNVCS